MVWKERGGKALQNVSALDRLFDLVFVAKTKLVQIKIGDPSSRPN